MNVVVLAGGLSSERNVSLSSGTKICQALDALGHKAALVDLYLGLEDYPHPISQLFLSPPALPPAHIAAQVPDLEAVKDSRQDKSKSIFGPRVLEACQAADVVFLGLHGQCGEDGRVQAAFDLLGVPYTGSGYLGSGIAMNKDTTKQFVRAHGVKTPDWQYLEITPQNQGELAQAIPLPAVLKVPTGGSSIGVSICKTKEELQAALGSTAGEKILVEEYIQGREFSCGVLENRALPPIEIIPKTGFYDYKNKYQQGATLEVCPAQLPAEKSREMEAVALKVHQILGLSAYSRSDFLMTDQGELYFLEVNTLPGMTPTSLIPQEAAAIGIDYPTLCQKLLDIALDERG